MQNLTEGSEETEIISKDEVKKDNIESIRKNKDNERPASFTRP